QVKVEPGHGPVAINRIDEDLAHAELNRVARPVDGHIGDKPEPMLNKDRGSIALPTNVDRRHDRLPPMRRRNLGDELGMRLDCGAEYDLLDAYGKNPPGLFVCADAATVRERHPALRRELGDEVEVRFDATDRRGNVEEDDLVDLEAVEEVDDVDGIA